MLLEIIGTFGEKQKEAYTKSLIPFVIYVATIWGGIIEFNIWIFLVILLGSILMLNLVRYVSQNLNRFDVLPYKKATLRKRGTVMLALPRPWHVGGTIFEIFALSYLLARGLALPLVEFLIEGIPQSTEGYILIFMTSILLFFIKDWRDFLYIIPTGILWYFLSPAVFFGLASGISLLVLFLCYYGRRVLREYHQVNKAQYFLEYLREQSVLSEISEKIAMRVREPISVWKFFSKLYKESDYTVLRTEGGLAILFQNFAFLLEEDLIERFEETLKKRKEEIKNKIPSTFKFGFSE